MKLLRHGPKGHEKPAMLDAQGQVRLFIRYGSGAEALAADLKTLLAMG